jgi:hypothetical protein
LIHSLLIRVAAWLVSDDELGDTVVGDFDELYANWRSSRGAVAANLRLVFELARSSPALAWTALVERGGAAFLWRSVPALVVGSLVFAAPLGSTLGGTALTTDPRALLGVVAGAAVAMVGGWVAAAVAGAAPRQHAFALGIGLMVLGIVIEVMQGRGHGWPCVLLQIAVVPAAAYGGERYWRTTHSTGATQ